MTLTLTCGINEITIKLAEDNLVRMDVSGTSEEPVDRTDLVGLTREELIKRGFDV